MGIGIKCNMRLTLEPTSGEKDKILSERFPKVVIELPYEDFTIGNLVEHMIWPALKAWGYLDETVERVVYLEEDELKKLDCSCDQCTHTIRVN